MTVKRFSSSSARVLLKKVIRKNYEMFRHETSMRKSFFRKATCSSIKKGFLLILFHWKFRQMSRKKKKLSKKLLTGLVSMNIFINLADLFQNNLFQNAQCRCIMSNPLENIFPFLTKPFLFNLFSFNWWDLMKN